MNSQQRAILDALAQLESEHSWPVWKCARVISDALEKVVENPTSIREQGLTFEAFYTELIHLASEGRYLAGQGNFGLDGSDPAPARNTECSLSHEGRLLTGSTFKP